MRIFSWVQTRFNGRHEEKSLERSSCSRSSSLSQTEDGHQGLTNWQGFLAIGTLGSDSRKEEGEIQYPPSLSSRSSQEVSDFTIEEVMKLQKELSKLLKNKPKRIYSGVGTGKEKANLPVNRFLNCPSSLMIDHDTHLDDVDDGGELGDLSPNSVLILRKARDLLTHNQSMVRRKSFRVLLKCAFICRGGFSPAPSISLRDPIVVSRMEKLLRIILHKKIFPQSSAPMDVRKYLENKLNMKAAGKDESEEKEDTSCKWDKTDSDFIVLEM